MPNTFSIRYHDSPEGRDMPNMADAIAALKADIRQYVQARADRFEQETGLSPNISVDSLEVTSHADKGNRFIVGNVKVSLGD